MVGRRSELLKISEEGYGVRGHCAVYVPGTKLIFIYLPWSPVDYVRVYVTYPALLVHNTGTVRIVLRSGGKQEGIPPKSFIYSS